MFAMTFYPKPMFWDFFGREGRGGGKMGPMFTDFLCVKSTHLGVHPRISYICEVPTLSPSCRPRGCRGTQIILISLIYGMNRYENMRILQPSHEKSVGKGHLFERVILAGTLRRGTPRVPSQPGCLRVCPP